jgi:hypothetical protein
MTDSQEHELGNEQKAIPMARSILKAFVPLSLFAIGL